MCVQKSDTCVCRKVTRVYRREKAHIYNKKTHTLEDQRQTTHHYTHHAPKVLCHKRALWDVLAGAQPEPTVLRGKHLQLRGRLQVKGLVGARFPCRAPLDVTEHVHVAV